MGRFPGLRIRSRAIFLLAVRAGERTLWGRTIHTSVYGARLSSVPSGDLQRVFLSASARKLSGPERLATSKKVFRTAKSAVPCRSSSPWHRASSSKHTRGQSRETGSLSTFSGSVEASAKCISMGPAHCREKVHYSVRVMSASVQWGISHTGGPQAGSGNGTRSRNSFEEGGHRGGPSSQQSQGSTSVTSSFRRRMGGCVLF